MCLRTVRLDDETEKVLKQVMRETGWSILLRSCRGCWCYGMRWAVAVSCLRSKFTAASTLGQAGTRLHLRLSHDWACSESCTELSR